MSRFVDVDYKFFTVEKKKKKTDEGNLFHGFKYRWIWCDTNRVLFITIIFYEQHYQTGLIDNWSRYQTENLIFGIVSQFTSYGHWKSTIMNPMQHKTKTHSDWY